MCGMRLIRLRSEENSTGLKPEVQSIETWLRVEIVPYSRATGAGISDLTEVSFGASSDRRDIPGPMNLKKN